MAAWRRWDDGLDVCGDCAALGVCGCTVVGADLGGCDCAVGAV